MIVFLSQWTAEGAQHMARTALDQGHFNLSLKCLEIKPGLFHLYYRLQAPLYSTLSAQQEPHKGRKKANLTVR